MIGGFLAYIAWISVNGPPFQNRYKLEAIVAGDSPVLKPGGQVREAGKLAGTITDVSPDGENLRVSMELRPDSRRSARTRPPGVRVRSIVYLTYVEIDPGQPRRPDARGQHDPARAHQLGRRPARGRAALRPARPARSCGARWSTLGEGLAGRGQELNAVARRPRRDARDAARRSCRR